MTSGKNITKIFGSNPIRSEIINRYFDILKDVVGFETFTNAAILKLTQQEIANNGQGTAKTAELPYHKNDKGKTYSYQDSNYSFLKLHNNIFC